MRQHLLVRKGLAEKVVDLELLGKLHAALVRIRRHQRYEGLVPAGPRLADRFHAAHLGHVDVDESEVKAPLVEGVPGLLAVRHRNDVERDRRAGRDPGKYLVDHAEIVRNQNFELEACMGAAGRGGSSATIRRKD